MYFHLLSRVSQLSVGVFFGQPVKPCHFVINGEAKTLISQLPGAAEQLPMAPIFYFSLYSVGVISAFSVAWSERGECLSHPPEICPPTFVSSTIQLLISLANCEI